MENEVKSTRMQGLLVLFDWHTDFFKKSIEGVSDDDAAERLNTKANHIAWLAGSVVQERFELANIFGINLKSSADELFSNHQGIRNEEKYPSLASYVTDWDKITPILKAELVAATDETLDKILEFPDMSFPVYEMVSFNTYREANCIGQIMLWRRLLGYEAVKYM